MKIALAQIDVKAGCPEINFENMRIKIAQAKSQNVDVIAFPELCVGGYLIGDLWTNDEYCRYLMSFNEKIKELSEDIVIIYGNVYLEERDFVNKEVIGGNVKLNTRGNDGRKIRYNAAYMYYNKKTVKRDYGSQIIPDGIQPKNLLPNYRYFDDKRYFYSPKNWNQNLSYLEHSAPFTVEINHKRIRIGVQLCEDMWCEDYRDNPAMALRSSDIIINLSASPWTFNKNQARDRRVKNLFDWEETYTKYDKDQKPITHPCCPPFVYVNCVGSQNDGKNILVFDGASTVYGQDGKPKILANNNYKEELLIFDHNKIPQETAERKVEDNIARKYQAIIRGIRHMSEVSNITKYIIGVSGGIDSAVVLCLLVEAIGEKFITAVSMPSKYNKEITKNAAKKLCNNLEIRDYRIIPIEEIVSVKLKTIFSDEKISSLTQENIQAETRGMILSAIAGNEKAFFTCNANKIEIAIGYATLNGDMRGAICPIADLTKEEVYQMGRYLNEKIYKKEIIPDEIFKIAPSAELKEDQVDPIKVKYHCRIIEKMMDYKKIGPNQILRWWLDGTLHTNLGVGEKLIELYRMNDGQEFINDLKWFCGRIRLSVFKRVQAPPIIITSKTSFGYDLRESILPLISIGFDEDLENKILNQKEYKVK